MSSVYMAFDRDEYEIFRIHQWQEHPRWDGETLSLDAYGDLYITARVGGRRVPRYPIMRADMFPDLAQVVRIYRIRRPEGGRFKIDDGGTRQVDSGRDLPYFIEFVP